MKAVHIVRPGSVDVVVAVLFAILTVPFSVLIAISASAWAGPALALVVSALSGAAMTAAVVLARGNPALALGIAWAAAILQMAAGLPPLPFDLAVFAVLFWTGVGPSRRLRLAGAISAVVATLMVTVYLQGPTIVTDPSSGVVVGVALVLIASLVSFALAWTFGLLWTTINDARAQRQEALAEHERGRIAREMHDVVAHSLAVIIAQADGARYASIDDPERAREGLTTVSGIARSALGDVRVLLAGLRHREDIGPQPTLDDLAGVIAAIRASGLPVEVDLGDPPPGVPVGLQLTVHRIVQESLTNALRHGRRDRPATVRLRWSAESVEVTVDSALDPARPPSGIAGHGITGMRERARIAGGDLDISTGERFLVRAMLPFHLASSAPSVELS